MVTQPVHTLVTAVHDDLTSDRHESDKPRGSRPDLCGTAGEAPVVYPAMTIGLGAIDRRQRGSPAFRPVRVDLVRGDGTIGRFPKPTTKPPQHTSRPPAFTIVNATITRTDLRIEHPFD